MRSFSGASDNHELRQMFHQSLLRINEIRAREQKAIRGKRYDEATQFAWMRIDEQERNNQILGQMTGAL